MRIPGKRILMVAAPQSFRDEELFLPRELLEAAGARVLIASLRKGQITGELGGKTVSTALIETQQVDSHDALLIVGGRGAREHLWSSSHLQALVRRMVEAGKLVAAICLAPVVLARADVLRGRTATAWASKETLTELEKAGACHNEDLVVESGSIITACGPEAAGHWAEAIISALHGRASR